MERICQGKAGKDGTVSGPISRVVRPDGYIHLAGNTDAAYRHFEGAHADAWRSDGQVVFADRQKVQADTLLRIGCRGGCNGVQSIIQATNGIAEKKIG